MEFTVLKTKVRISPLFFAVLTAFLLMDKSGIASEAVLFSVLHEMGHFFALLCAKAQPKSVEISAFGIHMELPLNLSTAKKCAVLMAGFAVNFILGAVLFYHENVIGGYINLFIGIFTAMPLAATDGGAVLKTVLEYIMPEKAGKITKTVSLLFTALLSVFLFALAVYTKNCYLLFAVCYMLMMAMK